MTLQDLADKLGQIGGCGDGYCIITGAAQGQHTNGGCRCYSDRMRMQRVGHTLQAYLKINNIKVPR